jgi:drug/metabolite transporter (DMT)-like permease
MNFLGEFSALGAALLWSFSSFLFTSIAKKTGTIPLNINRMILAAFLLLITILVFNIDYQVTSRQIILLSISGVIGLVLGDTFLFKSFTEIGPRVSMLLMSSNPAIAAILAFVILGETLSLWVILGIIATLFGIYLVIMDKSPKEVVSGFKMTKKGIFYGFMSAVGQGVGLVVAKMAFTDSHIDSLVATFIRITASIIVFIPIALVLKKYPNPFKQMKNDHKLFYMIFLGSIIGPYLGITLSFLAINYTKVGIASTLMSTTPILMLPLSHFIYKEKISFRAILGTVLAVAGVSVLFLF